MGDIPVIEGFPQTGLDFLQDLAIYFMGTRLPQQIAGLSMCKVWK